MRKQYHFKPSPKGYLAWDVERLIDLSRNLKVMQTPLTEICELDEPYWYGEKSSIPTCRSVVDHMQLILEVDLDFPIILAADHSVMDGMHRVARALLDGQTTILAKKFDKTPLPDFTDVFPEDLPY